MRLPPGRCRNAERVIAAAILIALAWGTTPASASAESARGAAAEPPLGSYCTPLGCVGPRQSGLAMLAGFGLATLAAALLARRQR